MLRSGQQDQVLVDGRRVQGLAVVDLKMEEMWMEINEIEGNAEARIERHRKGRFELRVCNAAGAPLADTEVTLRLTRHDFRLGANGFLIRGSGQPRPGGELGEQEVAAYEQSFAAMLNYATLPFYWGSYEPARGGEKRERLMAMAAWCREHGVRTKGHPLAWHEVYPAWAEDLPDAEVQQLVRERIARIVREFRGSIDSWDVFNEITVATRFENAVGRWVREHGAVECVAEALALARAANPDAELLYNDFNISPEFEELVEKLQERESSFDAIGIQSHLHRGVWSAEKLWQTCDTYGRFGLPLHFTELTILSGRLKSGDDNDWHRRHPDWASTEEGEASQLEAGRSFYTLLFSHPAVEAVTWWDFADRSAWQGAPAGLLRSDMSPKPLAEWLQAAFGERWTTQLTARSDSRGMLRFTGFHGTYDVKATTTDGGSGTGSCTFAKRAPVTAEVRIPTPT